MTNTELKALRRLFFLDVTEAAQFIGNCHVRTWQRWEQGTRSIPDDVVKMMNLLIEERQGILAMLSNNSYVDATTDNILYSRLIESVKAELFAKGVIDHIVNTGVGCD
ncbi:MULTISPECIES: Aca2/YdiL-like domain-containing protein [unclassified Gilliamella]|uniref:Aca2/YdiL-like domain-containing protein n=1 Tax=unclassified Gilliamella TaxID=2685620 RepID=UPI001322A125|nr:MULTISPECIES: DUF1870 family protein [unclassified Gilliamella]MWN30996.1 DUF1870 family protein [Gilliamella sp. Pra-s60]MWP28439.1 DUF1870 family protein [Gilliamella sp. Pra-s54]